MIKIEVTDKIKTQRRVVIKIEGINMLKITVACLSCFAEVPKE